jgi:hypothetical protein
MVLGREALGFCEKPVAILKLKKKTVGASLRQFAPHSHIAGSEGHGKVGRQESEHLLIQALSQQNFSFQSTESPMPFRMRVGKTAEFEVNFLQCVVEMALLQLKPGLLGSLCRGETLSPFASGRSDNNENKNENERSYGQGRPFTFASATVAEPLTGEPNSNRTMVSVLVPLYARTSAKNIFPN